MTIEPKQPHESDLDFLKRLSLAKGYRFEVSADGSVERMIRPDGTVAVTARKTPKVP